MISVIVPSLNSAAYLPQALRSALNQDAELEIVVQDGGSTDATAEVVASFDDPRIRFAHGRDRGQADAVNRAAAAARGDWLVWLNADDELAPGALAATSAHLDDDVDVVYGDSLLVNGDGRVLRTFLAPRSISRDYVLRRGMAVFSGSMIFRRSTFLEWGGLDANLSFCMDFELLARIADWPRVRHVPVIIGVFRIHGASKSGTKPWEFFREHRAVRNRFTTQPPRSDVVRDALFAVYLVCSPLRYSRAWSAVRKVKQR